MMTPDSPATDASDPTAQAVPAAAPPQPMPEPAEVVATDLPPAEATTLPVVEEIQVAAAAAEAPAEPEPAAAEPTPRPMVKRAPPRQKISDDTLSSWQRRLAADHARKQRELQAAQAARERAAGFRELRAALRRLEAAEPEPDAANAALLQDRLALAVHRAPAHIRTVIEGTLRLLGDAPKRGRPRRS